MTKYYLIPFETDNNKMICDAQPKYIDLFGAGAKGVISLEQAPVGGKRTWKQDFYLVKTVNADPSLDTMPDVLEINADIKLSPAKLDKLSLLGISGITGTSSMAEIEAALFDWLVTDNKMALNKI